MAYHIRRFYERLPKPTLIAIQELLDDQIYVREKVKKESLDLNTEDSLIDLSDESQEVIDDETSNSSSMKSEEVNK